MCVHVIARLLLFNHPVDSVLKLSVRQVTPTLLSDLWLTFFTQYVHVAYWAPDKYVSVHCCTSQALCCSYRLLDQAIKAAPGKKPIIVNIKPIPISRHALY